MNPGERGGDVFGDVVRGTQGKCIRDDPGGLDVEKCCLASDGIGVVQIASEQREPLGRLVLNAERHGEDALPAEAAVDDFRAKKRRVGIVDVAQIDVDQGPCKALVRDAPGEDLGNARLNADLRGESGWESTR